MDYIILGLLILGVAFNIYAIVTAGDVHYYIGYTVEEEEVNDMVSQNVIPSKSKLGGAKPKRGRGRPKGSKNKPKKK